MTSANRSEGSSLSIQELFTETQLQEKEQHPDSSNSNEEPSATESTPSKEQSAVTSSSSVQDTPTLTTIAAELRLEILKYLFTTPGPYLLRRRDNIDDENVIKKLAHTFDCSILFTCRKLYQESLAVFYASQTFHCSPTTEGHFSKHRNLMVNLSMDLAVVKQNENTEAFIEGTATEHPQMTLKLVVKDPHTMLSNLITEFAHHCPKLRTLTIHLLINRHGKHLHQDFAADLSADNATGSALRQLWPRLDSLSILTLGPRLHETLPNLRLSIAEDKHWSGKCWGNDGWFDQPKSGFDPTYDFLKLE